MNRNIDQATLLLRVSLGSVFIAHGLLKLLVFTLPGTAQFFVSVGFPGWLAYLVTAAEIGGGALLILGLWTRPIALALTPIMLGATWVHLGNGWLFTNANGGWEFPFFLTLATVVLALLGSGAYAIGKPHPVTR